MLTAEVGKENQLGSGFGQDAFIDNWTVPAWASFISMQTDLPLFRLLVCALLRLKGRRRR